MSLTYVKPVSRGWVFRQILFWLWLTLFTAFVLVFSFPDGYDLKPGDVAPQDIRAPRDFTYESSIRSRLAQDEAVRQVAPVYTPPDPQVARQQYDRAREVLAYLRDLRADIYATEAQRYVWLIAVPELSDIPRSTASTILTLPEANWNRIQLEFLDLLDQVMRQEEIRQEDIDDVRERVPSLVALDLAQDEAAAVEDLVVRFLKPNVFYDEAATEAKKQAAREAVGPTFRTLHSGEMIVREGSLISDLDVEALVELGLTSQKRDWLDAGVSLLLSAVLAFGLGVYLWKLRPEALDGSRLELLSTLLMTVFIIVARLLIPAGDLLPYLFPSAAMAMLVATTSGPAAAVGAMFFLGGVSGWIAGRSLGFAALVVLGGALAALTLPRYEQTGAIFRSGMMAGVVQAIVLFVFNPGELSTAPLSFLLRVGVCVVGGVVSGGLTVGGLFVLAPLFDLTTTFRLTELSRPNYPLLQRLLREAPGTFNHVMMVASLAEQAAERIGANALLTRVGAYYHDIGKLMRPYFFVENQQGLSNPHDRLDPYTSVDVLIGHIRDGMKLARQYHLPERVRAFIPEHHGTMRASFFYQRAIEAAEGEADLVDESQFRYPGPTPQSKETLLVMLADGSEAAARAQRPSTPEELAVLVDQVFAQRMQDGQLDQCPITMRELHTVKTIYVELLRGAFHPRVKYPEPKKNEDNNNEDNKYEREASH